MNRLDLNDALADMAAAQEAHEARRLHAADECPACQDFLAPGPRPHDPLVCPAHEVPADESTPIHERTDR